MIREELILQFLDQTIAAEDAVIVREWASKNPSDFGLMKEIWDISSEAKDIKIFDVDAEWESFMESVEANEISNNIENAEHISDENPASSDNEVSDGKVISLWKEWKPVAMTAAALFAVVLTYFLWPRDTEITFLAEKQSDKVELPDNTKVELPDNTIVSLEDGATISYPKSFKGKEKRIVKLQGIATFDVHEDKDQPFIVQTYNSGIKALGTIFEVDGSAPEVTGVKNIEGLIKFFEKENEENFVEVKEGESFKFDGKGFANVTPLPPTIKTFEAPPPPQIPYHSVREIVNYMYTISNGHAVPKGGDFDWNKKIQVDLKTLNLEKLIRDIQLKASLTLIKKDCSDCYEIRSFRVR